MKTNLLIYRLRSNSAKFYLMCLLAFGSSSSFSQNPIIYGMTYEGGMYGDGNIFKFTPAPMTYTNMVSFTAGGGSYIGYEPYFTHMILAFNGNLYGMTGYGGLDEYGNLFKYDPATDVYTDLIDFTGTNGAYPGFYPYGSLLQALDSSLYGMTVNGGVNGYGNIFKYNPTTGVFTDLVDFSGTTGSYIGLNGWGNLIQAYDSNLYGMTNMGGTVGDGNIFRYNPVTGVYTNLVNFTGGSGSYIGRNPTGSLLQATDSILYGMTDQGGSGVMGTLFSYNISTGTFTNLFNFTGSSGAYVGFAPQSSLIQATDGNLYGMTDNGGASNYGNIFKYNPSTSTFTDLVDFTDQTGTYPGGTPLGTLLQASDRNLYGLAEQGGAHNYGVLFQYNITTNVYDTMLSFTGTLGDFVGQSSRGDLMEYTPASTGINQLSAISEELKVYPNPNNGQFTIQSSVVSSQWSVQIYNVMGEKVFTETLLPQTPKGALIAIDLSTQPNGGYLYRVLNESGGLIGSGKVVIER
jgi:uncharacterized repeat protein (TIGR03803 family)